MYTSLPNTTAKLSRYADQIDLRNGLMAGVQEITDQIDLSKKPANMGLSLRVNKGRPVFFQTPDELFSALKGYAPSKGFISVDTWMFLIIKITIEI